MAGPSRLKVKITYSWAWCVCLSDPQQLNRKTLKLILSSVKCQVSTKGLSTSCQVKGTNLQTGQIHFNLNLIHLQLLMVWYRENSRMKPTGMIVHWAEYITFGRQEFTLTVGYGHLECDSHQDLRSEVVSPGSLPALLLRRISSRMSTIFSL